MSAGNADHDDDACPICLQPMPVVTFRDEEHRRFFCCGQETCCPCATDCLSLKYSLSNTVRIAGPLSVEGREALDSLITAYNCPMCRAKIPETDDERFRQLKSRVEEHDDWGWAHLQLGYYYSHGSGCAEDTKQAFPHFYKAAEQGKIPKAQHEVGHSFLVGMGVRESRVDAMRWFEAAAAQGYALSQFALAQIFLVEKTDDSRTARLFRAAAEQGLDSAQNGLAYCFKNGVGVGESLEKSLFWFKKAACQGDATAMGMVAGLLMMIAVKKYGGLEGKVCLCSPVGDCPLPEALYWGRKALATKPPKEDDGGPSSRIRDQHQSSFREELALIVAVIEAGIDGQCRNCGKSDSSRLSQCSRCKAAFYCSQTCQRDHWRKGHKCDCCDKDGVKLAKPGAQA